MQTIANQCVLCCEDNKFVGLTKCNHGPFCIKCVYKMRVISKSNACPICKTQSTQLVISDQFCKFQQIQGQILPDKHYSDVLHCGPEAQKEFQKLMQLKCFVKINGNPCKNQKTFPNIAFLKKHLKQDHKRVLCDVCLDKKTCVLEQQKLYTQAQLNRHLERGDIDESGNIIFMHPYCTFCKKYFFNDQEFRVHIGLEHMLCNVCGNDQRYRYYSNYDSLEVHYKISHYICSDPICLAKKFIAYRSAEELRVHKAEVHGFNSGKRIDGKQLCAFQYEGNKNNAQFIDIKDNQGVDMQEQFLALKKSKNRALGDADAQQNNIIDLRDFYPSGLQEDQHYNSAFVLRHKSDQPNNNRDENHKKGGGKKRKYISKDDLQKQKPQIAKENEKFTVQDLRILKTFHLSKLYFDDFCDRLAGMTDNSSVKDLQVWKNKFNKRQISATEFVNNFFNMMKKFSLKSAYEIFPHYIRTVTNQHAKTQLDDQYIKFLKKVPSAYDSILSTSFKYSDLFNKLIKQIQLNIESRITSQKLSIKKLPQRGKQRLFQIIGVVRRLKTEQMAKFKFASNFGVQNDTCEFIYNNVIKKDINKVQDKLNKIPNQQLLDLYVFIKYCYQAVIHSQNIHVSKNKIHVSILEDFLYERPELQKKYGSKLQQMKTLDQKIEYQKIQQERNHTKTMKDLEKKNKNIGYHAKTNFNLTDKGDFPELVQEKKKKEEDQRENYHDVMHNAKSKPATYQKKINELFPTLGGAPEPETSKKQQVQKPAEKRQKAWWQKLNDTKKLDYEEEQQVVKVRKGKNKKQKWVSVKGIFN